jgi:hypothetical protein
MKEECRSMKNSIALISVIALSLSVVVAAEVQSDPTDNLPILEKEIFGVRLGETVDSISSRCRVQRVSNPTRNIDDKTPNKFDPSEVYKISGSANNNNKVEKTLLFVFKGRVYGVEVTFRDGSERGYEIIKSALVRKYGSGNQAGASSWKQSHKFEKVFATRKKSEADSIQIPVPVAGRKVSIKVNRHTHIFGGEDVKVDYKYWDFYDLVLEELAKREALDRKKQARELEDDLRNKDTG